MPPLSVRQRLACVVAATVLCVGALAARFFETSPITPAAAVADITVDPRDIHAIVPATAFGVNTAAWDPHLLDKPVPSLLRRAGVSLLLSWLPSPSEDVFRSDSNGSRDRFDGRLWAADHQPHPLVPTCAV